MVEPDPSRRPHTWFTCKNLLGCPLEAISTVIPENFTEQFGRANAREYAKSLMRVELAVLIFTVICLIFIFIHSI